MSETRTVDGDTYEMMWDCKFCRTPKLLGLTHRHCPVCGAPQNAADRYFPDDAEKVRVADHVYVGRDLVCRHCGTYNSRNSRHCRDCGAPTSEGIDANVLPDQHESAAAAEAPTRLLATEQRARSSRRRSYTWLIVAGVAVLLVGVIALFMWKKEATFEVAGHSWERRIDIERFGPVRQSAWCDQLPGGARQLRRYTEVRRHEQIPDGETCTTRKVDQGDGTFREVKDCKPRYKSRPIEDYRCDYEVDRWSTVRSVEAKGQATIPAPTWPQLPSLATCSRVGCERAGAKRETYSVRLEGPEGDDATCEFDQSRWSNMRIGETYRAKVRVLGGGVDCSSLSRR